MEKFEIIGGRKIEGTIRNQGAKNSALPVAVASLLTDEEVILRNIPSVWDVKNEAEVLRATGAKVHEGLNMRICANSIHNPNIAAEAAKRIRSSILVPAALISRFSSMKIPVPGGDSIGTRKIDAYLLGLKSLGATFTANKGVILVEADEVRGTEISLHFPSVTATEGVVIASTLAEGRTIITNAAKEPEVVDLSNFLNSMGAKIMGAGTRTIKVNGVKNLHGTEYTIIPDRIAAGTFMTAAAITGGNLLIENVVPSHLGATTRKLRKTGVEISEFEHSIKVECRSKDIKATDIITRVHPGFPTDMQPIFMALMTIANGTSQIKETLYDGRFTHVKDLTKMGAIIRIDKDTATVKGVKRLKCSKVKARDIRSGAAMTLAGLAAEGITEVSNVYEVDRGYEKLDEVLSKVGAEIKRVKG